MRIFFVIITIAAICFSCGKKDDPEYKSFDYKNNKIQII